MMRTTLRVLLALLCGAILTVLLEAISLASLIYYLRWVDEHVGPDGLGVTGIVIYVVALAVAFVGWPILSLISYVYLRRRAQSKKA